MLFIAWLLRGEVSWLHLQHLHIRTSWQDFYRWSCVTCLIWGHWTWSCVWPKKSSEFCSQFLCCPACTPWHLMCLCSLLNGILVAVRQEMRMSQGWTIKHCEMNSWHSLLQYVFPALLCFTWSKYVCHNPVLPDYSSCASFLQNWLGVFSSKVVITDLEHGTTARGWECTCFIM